MPTKNTSSSLLQVRIFVGLGFFGFLVIGGLFWSANVVIWNEGARYLACQSGQRTDCAPSLVWQLNGWQVVTRP